MISPHTPPGTGLVVVWVPTTMEEVWTVTAPEWRRNGKFLDLPFLVVGQRCTLAEIITTCITIDGFAARVHENSTSYWALKCFDIAQLPKSITDLLIDTDVPVSEDA